MTLALTDGCDIVPYLGRVCPNSSSVAWQAGLIPTGSSLVGGS
jgi:hypothetical protein